MASFFTTTRPITAALMLMALQVVVVVVQARRNSMPYLREADLLNYLSNNDYDNNNININQWISIDENVEFLPNTKLTLPKKHKLRASQQQQQQQPKRQDQRRQLEQEEDDYYNDEESESKTSIWNDYNPYNVQPFVEGMSEYDEYQQAWRLLGFMIDCNSATDDDGNERGGGSNSQDVTEDGCARYVLWAAYVDLDYEGGGIGEYQYWDRNTQSWNDTACYYGENNGGSNDRDGSNDNNNNDDDMSRCAKMDCHMEDTNFSVLGFFKHRNYDDWMEQLFKHEGMCVWDEEEYAFMKNARKAWPRGCTDSGLTSKYYGNGSNNDDDDDDEIDSYRLYYDIKPLNYGRISLGLYKDSQCLDDYSVTTDQLEEMIGNIFNNDGNSGSGSQDENYDFSGDSLSDSMERWNSAFDVWHTCHPCVAYDIENLDGTKYLDDDDDGGYNYYGYNNNNNDDGNNRRRRRQRKLGGEYSAEGDVFECYDDAGYTNVNQCMKFSAKTVMKTATFRDLSLGRTQATLVEYPLSGFVQEGESYQQITQEIVTTYFWSFVLTSAFILSLYKLFLAAHKTTARTTKHQQQQDVLKQVNSYNNTNTNNTKKDSLLEEEDNRISLFRYTHDGVFNVGHNRMT